MIFYSTTPSATNIGMKFVLWEVVSPEVTTHDWGFAYWGGKEWEAIEMPEGYSTTVVRWANTIDPKVLLEDKRIITM